MTAAYDQNFRVPNVADIHVPVVSFLRTSEFGKWEIDDDQPSDSYVLHFRRGPWKRTLFGKKLIPIYGPTMAMRLCVTFRPTAETIRLGFRHEVMHLIQSSPSSEEYGEYAGAEVKALMNYLREYYDLAQPLELDG